MTRHNNLQIVVPDELTREQTTRLRRSSGFDGIDRSDSISTNRYQVFALRNNFTVIAYWCFGRPEMRQDDQIHIHSERTYVARAYRRQLVSATDHDGLDLLAVRKRDVYGVLRSSDWDWERIWSAPHYGEWRHKVCPDWEKS